MSVDFEADYNRVLEFLPDYVDTGILISDLQIRLSRGYSYCARLMDRLESEGYVSEYNGATPRKVFITAFGSRRK
jgi:DNA segregation ATPase FtsK/SpoIIIE-like protein